MTTGLTALAIIMLLAFINESMVEWVFGEWVDGKLIKYVALLGGLGLAFAFQVRMLSTLAGLEAPPLADMVLSGLVMGRGSQFVHDLYSRFLAPGAEPDGKPVAPEVLTGHPQPGAPAKGRDPQARGMAPPR